MVIEGGIASFCPIDHRIDKNRTIMRESSGDSVLDLGRVLDPNAANTDCFGHCCEIRSNIATIRTIGQSSISAVVAKWDGHLYGTAQH
jgi:hypothetical protein